MNKKAVIFILSAVAALLLIPFIAMQFSNEVSWSIMDFVVMGVLLLGTGFLCEFALRKVSKTSSKVALCVVILAAFLLVWAELAVGIIGSPLAGS